MIVKNNRLKSVFFFAPINTGLAKLGNPTPELISFHALRSNPYTGINYVGNVAIEAGAVTNANTLYINSSMSGYKELALAIERKGSVPGIQIACFNSKIEAQRNWKNKNYDDYINFIRLEIKKISYDELKAIIKSFQDGIMKLFNFGFRVIQLHGAHGYFLNNILSETFNTRDDEFGKDRTLIIKEILNGVNGILNDCIIDLRVSTFETTIEKQLGKKQVDLLNSIKNIEGVDIVSVSNGIYNINKQAIYPDKSMGDSFMLSRLSEYLKEESNVLWNVSGNVRDLDSMKNISPNVSFAIGRPIIADPDFILKYFEENLSDIIHCEYRNKCHYYSRKMDFIECEKNKKLF
jgi:2,4-dienoyl-CoA reductase-like NADH-dependent reductase (Old Yellow Enzyme family)